MERSNIYEQLNKERTYQNRLTKNEQISVADELIMIEYYLNEAKIKWVNNKKDGLCLDSLRKMTAVAVRCFENHGCPSRYLGYENN